MHFNSRYPIKLGLIGALGEMTSPMAKHLKNCFHAKILRYLDRGHNRPGYEDKRAEWTSYGAVPVKSIEDLVCLGGLDGYIVCVGKNGDDLDILKELAKLISLQSPHQHRPFVLHLSTVSVRFVEEAYDFFNFTHIDYANYPLTGGVVGAVNGTMLILAAGNRQLYELVHPMLLEIGRPHFWGDKVSAGAATKLIGHAMVFQNLLGLSSAIAIQSQIFNQQKVGGDDQKNYFDLLNTGAGGSKQWEVTLSKAVVENDFERGFKIKHALIDCFYTLQLMEENKLSLAPQLALCQALGVFVYLANTGRLESATQSVLQVIWSEEGKKLDLFLEEFYQLPTVSQKINWAKTKLSPSLAQSLKLEISSVDFA